MVKSTQKCTPPPDFSDLKSSKTGQKRFEPYFTNSIRSFPTIDEEYEWYMICLITTSLHPGLFVHESILSIIK